MNEEEIKTAFISNVERHLKAKGWDRTEFAEKLGVQLPHVSRMLNTKKKQSPGIGTLAKLGELFGVEPCDLLCEPGKPKKK